MKLTLKPVMLSTFVMTIAMGSAFAMIPSTDLKTNMHPDVGISTKLLSDIGSGVGGLPKVQTNKSNVTNSPSQQDLRSLVGKHFI